MEENVIISIKGSQLYEGQDPDVTELSPQALSGGNRRAIPLLIRRQNSPDWRGLPPNCASKALG